MATASFELDTSQLLGLVKFRKDIPKIKARAINKSAKSTKTAMVKVVRADLGKLSAKNARDGLRLRAARFTRDPAASIIVSTKRISLFKFGGTQLKRGWKTRLKGGTLVPGSFKATIGGETKVLRRKGRKRIPTKTLRGPSLGKVFAKHWKAVGVKRYREQIAKNLRSEIKFATRRR